MGRLDMLDHGVYMRELLVAHTTLGPHFIALPHVCPFMLIKVGLGGADFTTNITAHSGLLQVDDLHMLLKVLLGLEALAALVTHMWALLGMHHHQVVLVCFLHTERLLTQVAVQSVGY